MLFSKLLLAVSLIGTTAVMSAPVGSSVRVVEADYADADYKRGVEADYEVADYKRGSKADFKRGVEADYKRDVGADYADADYKRDTTVA